MDLVWTKNPPTSPGWVLVRNSRILESGVPTDIRVEPDGTMVAVTKGRWTMWGGPRNFGVYWGDTEFASIPAPEPEDDDAL